MDRLMYEYSILEVKGMYEAFKFFEMGNPKIGEFLIDENKKDNNLSYMNKDIGYKIIYQYKNYGLKFTQSSDYIINVDACRYEIENGNEVIKSTMNFDYSIIHNDIKKYNKIETEFGQFDINLKKVLK